MLLFTEIEDLEAECCTDGIKSISGAFCGFWDGMAFLQFETRPLSSAFFWCFETALGSVVLAKQTGR